jgi:hypothetical protein
VSTPAFVLVVIRFLLVLLLSCLIAFKEVSPNDTIFTQVLCSYKRKLIQSQQHFLFKAMSIQFERARSSQKRLDCFRHER